MRGPALVGALGFISSIAFSWVPSLWFDEVATVSATSRSWPDLFAMLGNVDLVHGLYYAVMKVWFGIVGCTPFTLRLPSAFAIGVAAALVVVLAERFGSRRFAVLAGVVFCCLPRITWAGTEGRSYAATTALAVALTLAFVVAWERRGAKAWVVYGALVAVSSATFLYLVLLVAAHGVTALLLRDRRLFLHWFVASALTGGAMIPFVLLVAAQSRQVDWIDKIGPNTVNGVVVAQWFYRNDAFAALGWVLVVAGIVAASRALRVLLVPWVVLPTGVLLAVSVLSPVYSARYLTFCAPAVAMLTAQAIDALKWKRLIAVALAACLFITASSYVGDRKPEAKQSSDWAEAAAFMATKNLGTGDAIIWGPLLDHNVATSRVIQYAYPAPFVGAVDVLLKQPASAVDKLWETRYLLRDATVRLRDVDTVWVISSGAKAPVGELADLGYRRANHWLFRNTEVDRYVR